MDILAGLRIAIDTFWYNIIVSFAGLHWSLLRGMVMMGHTVELINQWLSENVFGVLIAQTNASLQTAVSFAFVIALLVLGLTYLLAALVRLEVVQFRSALTWYVAGVLFFALGPSLYRGMNDFRMGIAEGFYVSTLQGLQGSAASAFGGLNQVETTDLGLGPLCDYLGVYLPGATAPGRIDGLDVALAYLRADGPDVMGYAYPMYSPGCPVHLLHPFTGAYISAAPQEWFFDGSYFDVTRSPYAFDTLTDEERAASIAMASSAHGRLLTAWPLVLFGVAEQIVYLLITIAMGITFMSFSLAILFAFFKKTEVIARAVIDQWIELIVQTVVIAMVQSLVVGFFLAGTASGNGMVTLGIGLIGLVFMLIVLWSGVKAVWNSLNRLFGAMGQATGGVILTPGRAGQAATSAAVQAGGMAVGVGSSALAGMTALNSGATPAQAAGISLGGLASLTSAARTLAYLPGVRGTPLGEAAEQFSEGALTRQVGQNIPLVGRGAGPLIGSRLLTDRDPDHAEYDAQRRLLSRPMLVPAVGEALAGWTVPRGAARRRANPALDDEDFSMFEDTDGQLVGQFTPLRPPRMGRFTPVSPQPETNGEPAAEAHQRQQRADYAAEMNSEELEQHVSGVMQSPNAAESRLQQAAEQLLQAAMLLGQLRVSGSADVASVMADVVALEQGGRAQNDAPLNAGIDTLSVGQRIAEALGVTPQAGSVSPITRDLARFGLFVDQALRLGLTPQQTEQVVREVQASPEGKMQPVTREFLDKQVQTTQNVSWIQARDSVDDLERSARLLPTEITAFGTMAMPTDTPAVSVTVTPQVNVVSPAGDTPPHDSALSGRDAMLGGE